MQMRSSLKQQLVFKLSTSSSQHLCLFVCLFLQLVVGNCEELNETHSVSKTSSIECTADECYLKITSNKKALQNMAAAHEHLFHKYASEENGTEGIDEHGFERFLAEVGLIKGDHDEDDHGGHDHDEDDHGGHDHDEDDHGGHDHDEDDHGGHDHDEDDHDEDDHGGHDHDEDDHGGHDHDEDDHGGHDHDEDDHGGHDHDEDDHGGHDHDTDFDISQFANYFYDYDGEDESNSTVNANKTRKKRSEDELPCFNSVEDVFQSYFALRPSNETYLTLGDFATTLPQILLDISRPECRSTEESDHDDHDHEHNHDLDEEDNDLGHEYSKTASINVRTWLIAFGSVLVISIFSLLIAVLLHSKKLNNFSFLGALASGALSGDALIHLLPLSFVLDEMHEHELHDVEEEYYNMMWKGLLGCTGVYFFYLVDSILRIIRRKKSPPGGPGENPSMPTGAEYGSKKGESGDSVAYSTTASPLLSGTEEAGGKGHAMKAEGEVALETGRKSSHEVPEAIEGLAWITVVEDRIHSFIFGFIIGVAFTCSIRTGLATSLAILCYKIPRGLEDFAILLKSGKTVKQAVLCSLVAALICFVGLVIGLLVGEFTSAGDWILASCAGVFIYVALVEMVYPMLELLERNDEMMKHFAIQNAGLLLGYSLMLIVAIVQI